MVVPTATMRASPRTLGTASVSRSAIVAAGMVNDSECMACAASVSVSTGLKVPAPTCSVIFARPMPPFARVSRRASVKWNPAVGAATDPRSMRFAYTVSYSERSRSSLTVMECASRALRMYGGIGVCPERSRISATSPPSLPARTSTIQASSSRAMSTSASSRSWPS